jgi:hypothetical protein
MSVGATATRPQGRTEETRPCARCHACGDNEITAICSNCGRLLCERHRSAAGPPGWRALLDPFRLKRGHDGPPSAAVLRPAAARPARTAGAGKNAPMPGDGGVPADTPGKTERPDPGAGSRGPRPSTAVDGAESPPTAHRPVRRVGDRPSGQLQRYYCADCIPRLRPLDTEMVAATTTTALGAVSVSINGLLGGVLLTVGVVRLVIRTVLGMRRRAEHAARERPELVLNPNVRRVKTRERIKGSARFTDERRCVRKVEEVVGSVTLEGNWSRNHRSVLDNHRRRTKTDPTSVTAGHVVLHGPGRVEFRSARGAHVVGGPALLLEPILADQPVLSGSNGHGNTRWQPKFQYDISPPSEGWKLPVWVTPNIAAYSDRHVLELHVQWSTRGDAGVDPGVPLRSIAVFELSVPASWGDVEHIDTRGGDATIGQPIPDEASGIGLRKLTWKKIPFEGGSDRGSTRLAVRFSDQIELDHTLEGRIEARFEGAVSGLTRIDMYRTDGRPAHLNGSRKPITVVDVDLSLHMKGLRYQEHRAVPDRARAADIQRREDEKFPDVVPDHRTVALLTNTLAAEGYYIIRVLENPAQSSSRPGALNRLWDLAGRYYEGVYPIDFHLVLSGEEIHKGTNVTGETTVTLTVHGSYANDDMERRVVEEWTRLWKRIRSSVGDATHGPGGGPRVAEQPLDASSSELARLRSVIITVLRQISDAAAGKRIDAALAKELIERLDDEFGLDPP